MKNPLRKRYLRELKSDMGKYIAIALFMIMLISLVSGYLVAAGSIEKTFYEGWDKYNVEDGHITFSKCPDSELLEKIEKEADLKFYDLEYIEEDIDDKGTTLRVFKDRTEIDGECLMEGDMPLNENEIVIDRMFAQNNSINVGDTIRLNEKDIVVTGLVALVDYNCLYENNNDMMFNASIFGVGVMSKDGYTALNSKHVFYNYGWKYNVSPADDQEENSRSEELLDILEEIIKEYDEKIVQAEVDNLYEKANDLSTELEEEFDAASDVIENKIADATKVAAANAVKSLTDEEKIRLYMQGAKDEDYFAYAASKNNKAMEDLVAEELGTTATALDEFEGAAKSLENDISDMNISKEAPKINLDEDDEYENDFNFSLDSIRDVVTKLDATGLYDVTRINAIINGLEELLEYDFDEGKLLQVENYIPKYQNKSITFCMDDMSSDKPMFILFDYIVVIILAFVFAVTIASTIQKEAGVIGTLRASGYTKGELVSHYLFMPMMVTIVASIIGNILGYTIFVNMMKGIFYNSFSLATYESVFNLEAFVYTTVIPLCIMLVINLYMLINKLQLSPIRFLRRDLAKKKKRRAVLLNKKIPFIIRFRLRILFQNISAYIVLSLGIFFGGVIAIFGFMFGPLLADYADLIVSEKICDYQYVVMEEPTTNTEGAEKYCLGELEISFEDYLTDEISVYGIEENSAYITKDIPVGEVLVSDGVLEKYRLKRGDTITLKEIYSDKTYDFVIADTYSYSASLALFMNCEEYIKMFDEEEGYFTGYFSNREIKDIDEKNIVTIVTEKDLTKVSDQMQNSMGEFMNLFKYFGAIMLALLMYLMAKQVIEKNAQSIAMTKILGFRNDEIARLYLFMTGVVVLAAMCATIPLSDIILRWAFKDFLYKEVSGYIPYIVSNSCYVYTSVICISCFVIVAAFMLYKIGRIEKSEALKNVE